MEFGQFLGQVEVLFEQFAVEPLPDARPRPAVEPFLLRLERTVFGWQVLPLEPVRRTNSTALTNRRLFMAVRPGSVALPGSRSVIRSHCLSVNSNRLKLLLAILPSRGRTRLRVDSKKERLNVPTA